MKLYRNIEMGKNMLSCNTAWTPEGINVGWIEFERDEQAMDYFGIIKKENLNIV
ncbi:MAG: hypothetical protein BWY47_00024 [Bacteroidetes bacterium ADurb.Bin302]|nr:MAG: hypothetical protein BWY47_00024 [Bacteroidetes bacterium ADurb.Bin302]